MNPFVRFLRRFNWRMFSKLACLAVFVLFFFSGMLPPWLQRCFGRGTADDGSFSVPIEFLSSRLKGFLPALSAFNFSMIAAGGILCLGVAAVLSMIFLLASFRKGRLFCSWVCPLGTCLELQARYLPGLKRRFPLKLNGVIFWTTVFSAALGVPLLLFLDPLSAFNRLGLLVNPPFPPAALIPLAVLLLIFLLCFWKPMCWCADCCPLGYLYTMAGKILLFRKRQTDPEHEPAETDDVKRFRREVLIGLGVGLPAAFLLRRFPSLASALHLPVLPPGARSASDFFAKCSRCYACVNTCPNKLITVRMPSPGEPPGSLFAPRIEPNQTGCSDSCNQCTQVCPAGAIRPLTLEEKNRMQIGIAKVDHSLCLAWAHDEDCVVCDEYCPYGAFKLEEHNHVMCPVVDPQICRGCGFCQSACPAHPGPAIRVEGVSVQKLLPPRYKS